MAESRLESIPIIRVFIRLTAGDRNSDGRRRRTTSHGSCIGRTNNASLERTPVIILFFTNQTGCNSSGNLSEERNGMKITSQEERTTPYLYDDLCDRHGRGRRRMSLQNKTNWLWLTKNPGKKEKDEYRPIKESVVSTTSK